MFGNVSKMSWAAFGYYKHTDQVLMDRESLSEKKCVTPWVYMSVIKKYLPTVVDADSIFVYNNASIYIAKNTRK